MNSILKRLVPAMALIATSCGVTNESSNLSGGNRRGGGESAGPVGTPVSNLSVIARAFEVQALLWRSASIEGLENVRSAHVQIASGSQISIATDNQPLSSQCFYSRKPSHSGRSIEEQFNCGSELVGSGEVESTIAGIYALVGSIKVVATFPEYLAAENMIQVDSVEVGFVEGETSTVVKTKFSNGSERQYTCSNPSNYYSSRNCSESSSH